MGRVATKGYCGQCRKRRIKCDLSRPACKRCMKSGYDCDGYQQPLRIHEVTFGSSTITSQQKAAADFESVSTLQGSLPSELSLIAFQEQMSFSYFFSAYRWGHCWRPVLQTCESDAGSHTIYRCSQAIAYGFMGIGQKQALLRTKGLSLYSQALQEVKRTVQDDSTTKATLAKLAIAILVLSLYPYSVENDLGLPHHIGISEILKHCGPESFQQEPLLTIFRSCRAVLICQSFVSQNPSFVNSPIWKNVPWKYIPKTAEDELLDIMADMPTVSQQIFRSAGEPEAKQRLRREVESLRIRLSDWRRVWDSNNPKAANEELPRPHAQSTQNSPLQELLSLRITLQTVQQAVDILSYNSALLYALHLFSLVAEEEELSALYNSDITYITAVSSQKRQNGNPLFMPVEVRHIIQPAIEAIRLLPYLNTSLTLDRQRRVLVTVDLLGILYCSIQSLPEFGLLMEFCRRFTYFEDAPREMGGYVAAPSASK